MAAIVVLFVLAVIFGSVYYTKMWKHKDDYYSVTDDYDFLSTYSAPHSINKNTRNITGVISM